MKTPIATTISALLCALLITSASTESFAGGSRVRLECRAHGPGDTHVDARYEKRSRRTKFDATYEANPALSGNFAGQILKVTVAGKRVGKVMLKADPSNGDLFGDIEFDTRRDEMNPFPKKFPKRVVAGDTVSIGSLGCDLR